MTALALAADVEAALLARGAVRRGRHLRVHCPAPGHDDVRPSCDVDLERGWVCRSCGRGGGLRDLAVLLGVTAPVRPPPSLRPPRVPPPPAGIARAVWAPAWTAIVAEARRQHRRLASYREVNQVADWLRVRFHAVAAARRMASALGDTPRAWALLALAAQIEIEARTIEADLDAVVQHVD